MGESLRTARGTVETLAVLPLRYGFIVYPGFSYMDRDGFVVVQYVNNKKNVVYINSASLKTTLSS